MDWEKLPSPYPNMQLWGTELGRYRYVISYDEKFKTWAASVSDATKSYPLGSFSYTELGQFETREAAVGSCQQHSKKGS